MIRLVQLLLAATRALVRRRSDLVLENLALRQQVAVLAASGRRPSITAVDRWFWLALRRRWLRWTEVLVFVKPETVVRWHRPRTSSRMSRLMQRAWKLKRQWCVTVGPPEIACTAARAACMAA